MQSSAESRYVKLTVGGCRRDDAGQDIIIRGGENLFPVQIENVLTAHPAISEAAAVAVPHPVLGEVVGAWIVREDKARHLSREEVREIVAQGMNPQVRERSRTAVSSG